MYAWTMRWWSIALYRDHFWVDNPDDRYSYSKTTVSRAADGSWRVLVSGAPQAGNWLPMGAIGDYGRRVIWRRLGVTTQIRDRIYEVSGTDPVEINILGAELTLRPTNA